MRFPVEGKNMSGVTVAQMTRSISSGFMFFFFEQIPYRFDAHVRGAERFAFEDVGGF